LSPGLAVYKVKVLLQAQAGPISTQFFFELFWVEWARRLTPVPQSYCRTVNWFPYPPISYPVVDTPSSAEPDVEVPVLAVRTFAPCYPVTLPPHTRLPANSRGEGGKKEFLWPVVHDRPPRLSLDNVRRNGKRDQAHQWPQPPRPQREDREAVRRAATGGPEPPDQDPRFQGAPVPPDPCDAPSR